MGGLASSLGAPQAPQIPLQNQAQLPLAGQPVQPAAPPAAPTPDNVAKHTFGKAVGSIFSGLSGTQNNYTINPTTGATEVTTTKAPPGQWARGILAAGLLGDAGIGPEHGEKTFAQGLLSGLTGGARARQQLSAEDDAKRKAAAQEDYANRLKAAENERANKELDLRTTLNKAQIAHDNAETAVQNQILHEHLKGEEGAASNLLIEGDKGKLQDYTDAGETPIQENLDGDQLQKLMQSEPGAVAKYRAVATGQKVVKDAEGVNHVETTYSLFEPLTKVPQTLVDRMQKTGLDKSAPAMYRQMADAAKNGTTVDYRQIAAAQREVGKQIGFQELLDKHREATAVINRDNSEAGAAAIRADKDKFELGNEKDAKHGEDLYNQRFNPTTGAVDTKNLNDADRALLVKYLNAMNQFYGGELLKYEKKDADGNYNMTDPAAVGIANTQGNVQRGLAVLQGKIAPTTPVAAAQSANEVGNLQNQVLSSVPPELSSAVKYFISDVTIKGPNGANTTKPAAKTLAEALQQLEANQSNPATRLGQEDYKKVVDALTQYYQNVGPIQQRTQEKLNKEELENRYVRLHALNPAVTRENQARYDDRGNLTPYTPQFVGP